MQSRASVGNTFPSGVEIAYNRGQWMSRNFATGALAPLADHLRQLLALSRTPVFRFENQSVIDQLLQEDDPAFVSAQRLLNLLAGKPQKYVLTAEQILDAATRLFDDVDHRGEPTLESVMSAKFEPATWPRWIHPVFTPPVECFCCLSAMGSTSWNNLTWAETSALGRDISDRKSQNRLPGYRCRLKQQGKILGLCGMEDEAETSYSSMMQLERALVVPDDPSVEPLHSAFPQRKILVADHARELDIEATIYFPGRLRVQNCRTSKQRKWDVTPIEVPLDVRVAAGS